MKNRFVVLDPNFNCVEDCDGGDGLTEAAAVKLAKSEAAEDDCGDVYYVAEIVGVASSKVDPRPVKYTELRGKKR